MFRLLSDLEVSLNELLVACRESVDHFRDGAQIVASERIAQELTHIGDARETFIPALEQRIRELGDLPTMPDPDKEDSEMLLHRIGAAVTDNYTNAVLQQRMDAEKNILALIAKARTHDENNTSEELLNNLHAHAGNTIEKLSAFAELSPL